MARAENIEWDPDEYDTWYEKEPGRTIDLIETECALSFLLPANGKRILDVGCGTGNFTRKLSCLGYDVIGIDPSDEMVEKALKKGLSCIKGYAEKLPFDDETFDGVISVAAIEFFKDRRKAVNEMLRVVRNEGKVVVCFITGSWAKYYRSRESKILSRADFPKIEEFLPLAKEVKLCLRSKPGESADFSNERTMEETGFACILIEKRSG